MYSAKDIARLEELELRVAQYAREAATQRRRADGLYNRVRRLETLIRNLPEDRQLFGDERAWANLMRAIPKKPRPTIRQLREKHYKRR